MTTAGPISIEKLRRDHDVSGFQCGDAELDRYIARFAFANQQAHAAQTYVGVSALTVIGFYSLAAGHAIHEDAPLRVTKGLARHPIPVMLLARLAVSIEWAGRGVGAGLLKDALLRVAGAAEIGGIRAIMCHAKNEAAMRFYAHFDFISSPTDPLHMFFLVKNINALLRR